MEWIRIEDELPPKKVPVWVKRCGNKFEDTPIYLAMRNGQPLSTNSDASRDCHWYGTNINSLINEQSGIDGIKFDAGFSDITVIEWAFVDTIIKTK